MAATALPMSSGFPHRRIGVRPLAIILIDPYSVLSSVSFFYPFRARYFSIIGSRSASGGSASVTLRAVGSTSRRPIRFKAIVLYAQGVKTRPLVLLDPRKSSVLLQRRISDIPCSIGWVTNLVVTIQPLFRFTAAAKLINRITYLRQMQPDRA
jgi:hypothetical protein